MSNLIIMEDCYIDDNNSVYCDSCAEEDSTIFSPHNFFVLYEKPIEDLICAGCKKVIVSAK